MSPIRRYFSHGNQYFITTVTHQRKQLLTKNIDLLQMALLRAKERFDTEVIAWVALPDHLHLIINTKDFDPSKVMKTFKQYFGLLYRQRLGNRSGKVWQRRFWDHIIRDQDDMNRHIDYIHYNPVKHGIVKSLIDYPHSSFQDYIRNGFYQSDWGQNEEFVFDGDFGE